MTTKKQQHGNGKGNGKKRYGRSCGDDPTHRKLRDGWGTRTVGDYQR